MKTQNKKKLIAYAFVLIMVLGAFAGIASYLPASGPQSSTPPPVSPLVPSDISAASGSTVDVYYTVPVNFPTATHDSSSTATSTNTNTACSTSGYPAYPSYPSYPAYPSYPSDSSESWTLDIGSTQLSSGSASATDCSHSQSQSQGQHQKETHVTIKGETTYYYYSCSSSYSHSTTTWENSVSPSYTFDSYGSSSGTDCTWTVSIDGTSESGTLDIFSPTVTATTSQAAMDVGQTITLGETSSNLEGTYSYSWSESGASGSFSSTTVSSPTWTASGTGTASFTLNILDSSGNSIASSNESVTVSVQSDPTISVSSSLNPSDSGQSVDFSTAVSGGSGTYSSYSYVLYDGTSTSDSQLASGSTSSFSYTFSGSGQFMIKYSVTDTNGYTVSSYLNQTVYPDPQAHVLNSMTPGVFNVYSYVSGPTEGAVPYSDVSAYPLSMPNSEPNNVSTWAGTFNDGGFGYDYGNPGYSGDTFLGRPVEAYPSSLGVLNTEPSGGAYDEGYMAVTVLHFAAGNYTFNGEYDDNGAMFISHNGTSWKSIIGSSAWIPEGATAYSGTETLTAGWYFFAVVNGNLGGGPSMSALNITGGNISTSGTPPIGGTTDTGIQQYFLTAVEGGAGSGYSYSTTVNGNTYTSPAFNTTFTSSGSYAIDLSAKDGAGYTATASQSETVKSDPTVSASSNVSSADVNYPIEFSASPSGGTGPYSNSWTLNGNVISTSQDFSYAFSSPGTYTLTDTLTDSVGETYSASVTVTIHSNPTVTILSSQNPTDSGNSVYFSSSVSGGISHRKVYGKYPGCIEGIIE